jgi:hypothetical protein
MRVFAWVLAAVAALQSQPTFRTGVELIRIDVTVLDKAGAPVTGLQPEDFTVTIDGDAAPGRVCDVLWSNHRRASARLPCSERRDEQACRPGPRRRLRRGSGEHDTGI